MKEAKLKQRVIHWHNNNKKKKIKKIPSELTGGIFN